jgi:hypothetical protein
MMAVESTPFTGIMATCMECHARGSLHRMNDGWVDMNKAKKAGLYEANRGQQFFERPADDVITLVPLPRSNAVLSRRRAASFG